MSVINKMLRDLDNRQAAGTVPVQSQESGMGLAPGAVVVNAPDRAGRRLGLARAGVLLVTAIVVLGGIAAWWYLKQAESSPRAVEPVSVVPVQVQQKTPAPDSVASQAPATVNPVSLPPMPALATAPVAEKLPVPASAPATVPQSVAASTDVSLKTDRPATNTPVPATVTTVPAGPPRLSPALAALAQAQSLWNSGAREAAIDLVREALAAAERTNFAGTSAGNNSVLATLARELARMELAEGRVGQALELLTRLEPALSGVADVWAIRGNAAQRLGRHPESAAAYLMALKLRPDEPRWMLGAAVSLAAQGQTAAAAELAEKARAGGVLSPEVATYLRQLGVPLPER